MTIFDKEVVENTLERIILRTILELLILVKDYIKTSDENHTGLCSVFSTMCWDNLITASEEYSLLIYLDINIHTRMFKEGETYYWDVYCWKPRLAWINRNITKQHKLLTKN